jgi:hypothetical protein
MHKEKTISGVVSDENGPILAPNVIIKGTKNVVQTDIDGRNMLCKTNQG